MNSKELFSYFKAHQAEFTNLLQDLVSFQTYSLEVENLNQFVHYLENVFKELDLTSTRCYTENGDLISFVLNPEQSDFIVLLAHMDTVKVSAMPEPVKIEKNRLYGNGVYDMKNAIALFYFTLKAIRELGIKIDKRIKIILNPDEEVGITGLSLRTRVAWEPGMRGREYEYKRVQPGTYRIVLTAGGKTLEQEALIMQDYWYEK